MEMTNGVYRSNCGGCWKSAK